MLGSTETTARMELDFRNKVRSIGKYQLIARLGVGGSGEVYLGVAQGPGGFQKLQVIKLLRHELCDEPRVVQAFLEEAKLAAKLHHKNIVQTHEVGEDGQNYFIAMEYLEGWPFHVLLQGRRQLEFPIQYRLRVISDVLCALAYAHHFVDFDGTRISIIHRDVSPHNVMVTYDGLVKLLDFGIAKASNRKAVTESGAIIGKLAYMAPEQLASARDVDPRSDIFAVGIMLWESATGRRFWGRRATDGQIIQGLSTGDYHRSPRVADPNVPDVICDLCERALAYHPHQRIQSAAQFQHELDAFLRGFGEDTSVSGLSRWMAVSYASERATVRSTIETELGKVPRRSIPDAEPGVRPELPLLRRLPSFISEEGEGAVPELAMPPGADRASTEFGASWQKRFLMGFGAVGVLGAAAVAASVVRQYLPANPGPLPAANAALSSGSRPTGAPKGRISLEVRTVPEGARLRLDGQEVRGNPYRAEFDRDGSSHELRADAPGYVSLSQSVSYDQDRSIVLKLEPAEPPKEKP